MNTRLPGFQPRIFLLILFLGGIGGEHLRAQELEWRRFEEALTVADTTNRFVLVDVYAPWCGWCHRMKTEVYPSEQVRRCIDSDFVLTRLNRDNTETDYTYQGRRFTARRLAAALGADGVPTIVLLSPEGNRLMHLSGFVEPEPLTTLLAFVSTRSYRHASFDEYRRQRNGRCEGRDGRGGA